MPYHEPSRTEPIERLAEVSREFEQARLRQEPDVLEEFEAYRRVLLRHADRVVHSRIWRWGHSVAKLRLRAMRRPPVTDGAPARLIALLRNPPAALDPALSDPRAGRRRWAPFGELLKSERPISVVIPVHGAAPQLAACIAALARNTSLPSELIIVDDGSEDPGLARLLARCADHPRVRILRTARSMGFAHAVNRGVRESDGDVVILNSDTEVTPRWLENLAAAAYSAPDIGTATPLSTAAGALSLRELDTVLASGLSPDDAGRAVTQMSAWLLPAIPAGSGFCMYVRRSLLDAVGLLDERRFPAYGEETDLCMRAAGHGWRSVLADSVFVLHQGAASFGRSRLSLLDRAQREILQLHPGYPERQRAFADSPAMELIRMRVERAGAGGAHPKPRVLLLNPGGRAPNQPTPPPGFELYELRGSPEVLKLLRHGAGGSVLADCWELPSTEQPGAVTLESLVLDACLRHAIELVLTLETDPGIERLVRRLAPTLTIAGGVTPSPEKLESATRARLRLVSLPDRNDA